MEQLIVTQATRKGLVKQITSEVLAGIEAILEKERQNPLTRKELLSIKEVSELFGITKATVHDWSNKGILRPNKVGHRTLFKTSEVMAALSEKVAKRESR